LTPQERFRAPVLFYFGIWLSEFSSRTISNIGYILKNQPPNFPPLDSKMISFYYHTIRTTEGTQAKRCPDGTNRSLKEKNDMAKFDALAAAAGNLKAALNRNVYHCANNNTPGCPHLGEQDYCHRITNCQQYVPDRLNIKRVRQLANMLTRPSRLGDKGYVETLTTVL
jgi:hypothetical protein